MEKDTLDLEMDFKMPDYNSDMKKDITMDLHWNLTDGLITKEEIQIIRLLNLSSDLSWIYQGNISNYRSCS